MFYVISGILLPFVGTSVGSAAVFFLKNPTRQLSRNLGAFASGVMVAASVWSLIIPAVEMCGSMGRLAFLPALIGITAGFGIILFSEHICKKAEKNYDMNFFAITLHNFPEGMAVGMMFAMWLREGEQGFPLACFAFSVAIALQNIPEGAIISMPAFTKLKNKSKGFAYGVLSGAVEPVGAFITLIFTGIAKELLPYLFGFAAGAMLCAVCGELSENEKGHPTGVPLCFAAGFCIMMSMDVSLG